MENKAYKFRQFVCLLSFVSLSTLTACTANHSSFYQPPQPLPIAPHGTLIRAEPLTNSAALPSAGRNLRVLYHSRNLAGQDVAVSGTIAIPPGKAPAGGWPVTTWTHGTTGIGPSCAPSKDTPDGPEHFFLKMKQKLMDAYVKRGYVVVATDYEGLGPKGLHPFLQGVSEAHGALDIVRLARAIDPRIGHRYVIIGHSQGGQADLFAATLGPKYIPELVLLGNVAMAPASHIGLTIKNMIKAPQPSYQLAYIMYVLQSFASNHPEIDLSKILTSQALAHLAETRDRCISATVKSGYWSRAIPKDQFQKRINLAEILQIAEENEPGHLKINVPTLIVQGAKDDTVLPACTDAVVAALCKRGNNVRYRIYKLADHETIPVYSENQVATWVNERFLGAKAVSNCRAFATEK